MLERMKRGQETTNAVQPARDSIRRKHVGEPGERIDIVELCRLCRPLNYAERVCFLQRFS
jgi:hypothetical protein